MRKRLLVGGFGALCALLGGLVVQAASPGSPEIDRANATYRLSGTLKSAGCVGEDQTDYVTYRGSWKGAAAQQLPDPTDYALAGNVAVTGIKWTINSQTGRGMLTGAISVTDNTGAVSYSGKLILVSDGRPATTTTVPARGWIDATFQSADDGIAPPNDDNLIANVEFQLSPSGATGQFGDVNASLGFADYSAVTNLAPKPADGTC
jgi:hypothetical protein